MITSRQFRHIMWYTFIGTKGGHARINIVKILREKPHNAHQLSKKLKVDYRTILHHLKILRENQFVSPQGKKYGELYFLTELFENEIKTFDEIMEKL
jgi:predicted transcriptional regulator